MNRRADKYAEEERNLQEKARRLQEERDQMMTRIAELERVFEE